MIPLSALVRADGSEKQYSYYQSQMLLMEVDVVAT